MARVARHYPAGRGEEISIRGKSWPSVRFTRRIGAAPDIGISPVAPIPVPIPHAKGHAGIVAGIVEMGRWNHLR